MKVIGGGIERRDPAWKHYSPMEGNKNWTICNYCGMLIYSGGITRFKFHLAHRDLHNNTKKCLNLPPKVENDTQDMLHLKTKAKAKKTTYIEEICA